MIVFRQWKEKWIHIMNILMATLHFFPLWSWLRENGSKLLLYKLGEKCFESTEYKIKELEVLQIPADWRKGRLLKCVILIGNCFCNWEATYQPILAVYTFFFFFCHVYFNLIAWHLPAGSLEMAGLYPTLLELSFLWEAHSVMSCWIA